MQDGSACQKFVIWLNECVGRKKKNPKALRSLKYENFTDPAPKTCSMYWKEHLEFSREP